MSRYVKLWLDDAQVETLKREAARKRREWRGLKSYLEGKGRVWKPERMTWKDAAQEALNEGIADAEMRLGEEE